MLVFRGSNPTQLKLEQVAIEISESNDPPFKAKQKRAFFWDPPALKGCFPRRCGFKFGPLWTKQYSSALHQSSNHRLSPIPRPSEPPKSSSSFPSWIDCNRWILSLRESLSMLETLVPLIYGSVFFQDAIWEYLRLEYNPCKIPRKSLMCIGKHKKIAASLFWDTPMFESDHANESSRLSFKK